MTSPIVVLIHLKSTTELADFIGHFDANHDIDDIQSIHFQKAVSPTQTGPQFWGGLGSGPNVMNCSTLLPDPNRGRVEELEGQVKILNELIRDLQDEKQTLLDAENDMARRMRQLEERIADMEADRRALLDQRDKHTKHIEELSEAFNAKSDKLLVREDEIRRLQKQLEDQYLAWNSHVPELRAKIDALETENRRLRTQPTLNTPDKLNPIHRAQVTEIINTAPKGVSTTRYQGLPLADLSRYELLCIARRLIDDLNDHVIGVSNRDNEIGRLKDENKRFYDQNKRLCDQNAELIATMRDMQEKALKEHAARFGETTLHQLIGENGEVVHAPDVSIEQIPTQVIDAIQDLARRTTPLAGKVVFESNAGAIEPNWQTNGVVQHAGFDPSKPHPGTEPVLRNAALCTICQNFAHKYHDRFECIFNPNHTADIVESGPLTFRDTTPRPAEPAPDMPF